jgi:hypothetical protein
MSNEKFTLVSHAGDSAPPRVKLASFLTTPFVGLTLGISRLLGVETSVVLGPKGQIDRKNHEDFLLIQMGTLLAKYSDDVVELSENENSGERAGYVPPDMHAAIMHAAAVARGMGIITDFIAKNNIRLGTGVPQWRECQIEFNEDSQDTSESQPKGDK